MSLSRRNFMKVAGFGALAAASGSALAACGSSSNGAPSNKNQVVISMTPSSEPEAGFDPLVSWGCGEHVHEPLIQSTLITTDLNLEFVNDLATAYSVTPDGLTWTFTLRDDVKFTDGHPLTAKDVAFTINGIAKGDKSEADLSMVKEARIVNDATVEIELAKPFNALLYTLAVIGIVPEHAYGPDYGKKPIGSGRYMLEQWDQGQQVILKANPDYYGDAPKMERVVVVFMEEDASLAGAKSGKIDVAYTSPVLADAAPSGYELLSCKSVDSRGISLPTGKPGGTKADGDSEYPCGNDVTSDIAVRKAINMAVDRDKMIKNVLNGHGTVAYSVGDGLPWSSSDMKIDTDIEGAKKLLDEAGWTVGSDNVRAKDGVRASLNLYYSAKDSARQAMANEFANQMAGIGIEVKLVGESWDEIYKHEFSDLIMWGWGSNAPIEWYELNYSKGWGNYASYENEALDAYMDAALAKPTVEESYELWKKVAWDGTQGVAPKGAATWVWFANIDHLYLQKKGLKVAQQKPHPHGHGWSLVNNVDQWSWE